jgi:hypothetical protein
MATIAGTLAGGRDEPLAALAGAVAQTQESLPGLLESARGGYGESPREKTKRTPSYQPRTKAMYLRPSPRPRC